MLSPSARRARMYPDISSPRRSRRAAASSSSTFRRRRRSSTMQMPWATSVSTSVSAFRCRSSSWRISVSRSSRHSDSHRAQRTARSDASSCSISTRALTSSALRPRRSADSRRSRSWIASRRACSMMTSFCSSITFLRTWRCLATSHASFSRGTYAASCLRRSLRSISRRRRLSMTRSADMSMSKYAPAIARRSTSSSLSSAKTLNVGTAPCIAPMASPTACANASRPSRMAARATRSVSMMNKLWRRVSRRTWVGGRGI
mmetsp:Transcript_48912/g.151068  ORF Transcript_48912/g.151068 Transcript_48912/m.151068 type:complete len:260 (+) Transcript_48912:240-1019(+)